MKADVKITCPQYCNNKVGSGSSARCIFSEEQVTLQSVESNYGIVSLLHSRVRILSAFKLGADLTCNILFA